MKKLAAVILLALPASGCGGYAVDRVRDFGDIWRIELGAGGGLQADAAVGELLHLGVGSSRRWSLGWRYGEGCAEKRVEDHFPLSIVWSAVAPDTESLHSLRWGDGTQSQHRCSGIVPGELRHGSHEKASIHYWDIEVNVFALLVGANIGFSIGQFVDWITGFFGADLGDDDGERRPHRKYWKPIEEKKDFDPPRQVQPKRGSARGP